MSSTSSTEVPIGDFGGVGQPWTASAADAQHPTEHTLRKQVEPVRVSVGCYWCRDRLPATTPANHDTFSQLVTVRGLSSSEAVTLAVPPVAVVTVRRY